MSTGYCTTCGAFGPVEFHHVAGDRLDPDWTTPVCLTCHGTLSALQRAAGIPLDHHLPAPSPLDRLVGAAVGLGLLVQVACSRLPADLVQVPASVAALSRRAVVGVSAVGWGPDPSVPIHHRSRLGTVPNPAAVAVLFDDLIARAPQVLDCPLSVDLDPAALEQALVDRVDPDVWSRLVGDFLTTGQQLWRRMLSLGNPKDLTPDDARDWEQLFAVIRDIVALFATPEAGEA